MTTITDDLTATQWAAMWSSDGGFAVILHEGVEVTNRVPCRVVVVERRPGEIMVTIDRRVEFTFGEPVAGVTLYAESDGLVLRRDEPGLVLNVGDSVQFDPHGLDAVSRLAW